MTFVSLVAGSPLGRLVKHVVSVVTCNVLLEALNPSRWGFVLGF
jgi:hypothetical protein